MSKSTTPPLVRFSIALPEDIYNDLNRIAENQKRSKGNMLVVILDDHLESYDKSQDQSTRKAA